MFFIAFGVFDCWDFAPSLECAGVLKSFFSLLKNRAATNAVMAENFSGLPSDAIADLYEDSYLKIHRYVDFAWQDLQQPRPKFAMFQQHAMTVEAAHQTLLTYYGEYLGLLKELDRCGIRPKALSPLVSATLEKMNLPQASKDKRPEIKISFDA